METAVLALLIIINGFFAMSEISLVTARRGRLQRLIDSGDRSAKLAVQLGSEPTKFLSTIQIGITSVGLLSGIVGEATLAPPLAERLLEWGVPITAAGYLATGIVVALVTYFAIVVGELVPKRIAQTHAEGIARNVARPIQFLSVLSRPFVWLLSGSTAFLLRLLGIDDSRRQAVTEEEIHAVLAEGSEAGVIEKEEHRMVRNLFRLDELSIVSLMTPRMDMITITANATREQIVNLLDSSPHTRYPVVDPEGDDIVGVISARELLLRTLRGEELDLSKALHPAVFVPETISGMNLLESFRKSGDHLTFIVNEYGTVLGLITLHDVLEAITGSINDSAADENWAVQREDGSWLFDGHVSVHELFDYLELRHEDEVDERRTYRTLSGLIIHELGRLPRVSDQVGYRGWQFEVVDMDGRRIDRVMASRVAVDPMEAG